MKWLVMTLVLVLVAVAGFFVFIKRKSTKILSEDNYSIEPVKLKPQITAPKPEVVQEQVSEEPITLEVESETVAEVLIPANVASSEIVQAVTEQFDTIPEDSALRRHDLSAQEVLNDAINPPPASEPFAGQNEHAAATESHAEVSVVLAEKPDETGGSDVVKPAFPEDSALRRHVLTLVQAKIQDTLPPKPTDATLVRHYESLFAAKVADYLAENFS